MEKGTFENIEYWTPPKLPANIPYGDMPGDKVKIEQRHVELANVIFPRLLEEINERIERLDRLERVEKLKRTEVDSEGLLEGPSKLKFVVSVYGGSGVGKSEVASLLSYYFNQLKMGSYTLSGDNYPHRIPRENDGQRLRVFTEGGEDALGNYLGTDKEINFEEISNIIKEFKDQKKQISLKRMGREKTELWYDQVDFSNINVLIVEWTHGNNENLCGVDFPIFLSSTPEETLAHRKARNRDGGVDSEFTTLVLNIEQKLLESQAGRAKMIVTKKGELIDYFEYIHKNYGIMLNAYPDSIGGNLTQMVEFLKKPEIASIFQMFYILPSVFNSDLDRGFSVIDYQLNDAYAKESDLEEVKELGIGLKLDFVLNHISVQSPQFQDIIKKGLDSKYREFFINWNEFWEGAGELTEEGYIQPDEKHIKKMFFRKPGLPLLMVKMPDGSKVPYWNTFYQKVLEDGYLGQMDLNVKSPLVWEYYQEVLKQLADYGSKIVRLDAFAYAHKEVGEANFMNEPGTWDLLSQVEGIAKKYQLELLPEIHSSYEDKTHEVLSDKGYLIYDFFLPGLLIDAIENGNLEHVKGWAGEIVGKKMRTINMLGCHDGIPLLDLKGILTEEEIQNLIRLIVSRGGYVKNLHGQKNMYYQVNATYYSALGNDDRKMLLARAIQVFMPGIPQVWYLDLFVGKNDYTAVERAGEGGHKEINRTNLTMENIEERLQLDVVKKQLQILEFRNHFGAFHPDGNFEIITTEGITSFMWEYKDKKAILDVDICNLTFTITAVVGEEEKVFIQQF